MKRERRPKTGDLNQQGQDFYSGSLTLTGNSLLFGDQTVSDDIYLGQTVYHKNDEDTLVRLTNNKIDIEAGTTTSISLEENGEESVKFFTSGEEQMRQTKEGFIGINTTTPIAELSVTGEAFLENAFAYDRDCGRKFRKVFGGDDETVAFKTHLKEGEEEYKIELPKTFKVKPIISAELQHENGGIILPLIISNVSTRDFVLKLGSTLPDKHYHLHTTALSPSVLDEVNAIHYSNFPQVTCSDHASNRHGIQRFSTRIQQDSNEHEITFPFGYSSKPIVTVTIEGPNNIIPYAISSVNNSSYKIIFGTNVNQDYTIHTFFQRSRNKKTRIMNKDNRISNLIHTKKLVSDGLEPFPYSASINTQGNKDNEVLFLLSNSGEYNEKIQYKNLKKSILDNSVFLTGNQLISGEKTFADSCTFLNNIYMNEIIDITETGDISGNIFVGQSGLFERLGSWFTFYRQKGSEGCF